jgi:hypothetical protein
MVLTVTHERYTRSGQKQGAGELNVYRVLKSSISKEFYFQVAEIAT